MRSRLILAMAIITLYSTWSLAAEGQRAPLWPEGAPGANGSEPNDIPTLTTYLPTAEKNTGCGIVVCPGGGYGHLATGHEGVEIADWLNDLGIAAFVLEYRHSNRGYQHPAPLQDAQHAVRTARAKAKEYQLDPAKIGILGFSAGGHLASSAGTHFDAGNPDATDPIEQVSSRPDFMILCYPVIVFDKPYTHRGSQNNLLGNDAPAELVESMSSEKQVTADTPPTFLFHTTEDTAVPPRNSVDFYLALIENKVPAEMHLFEKGRHGVGLAKSIPGTSNWSRLCHVWLQNRGMVPAAK